VEHRKALAHQQEQGTASTRTAITVKTIQMKVRMAMTKVNRVAHPARRARIATTGLSLSAMVGMISAFGWNAQVAAKADAIMQAQAAKQAQVAAQIAARQAAAKPHVKVVVVTVPAPVKTRYVTQPGSNSGSQNSSTYNQPSRNTQVVAAGSNVQQAPRTVNRPAPVKRPAPVVHTAPVVVYPPAQTSQATSGGSKKP